MKLKNLLFVFCLALLAGCQKDPDTESTPVRDTDKVEGVIRMKLDRETAEALNVIRTRSGRVLTGNISFDELCERYNVTGMERLFADNGCAERTRKAGLDLWYIIRFEGSAEQVAEDFGEIAGVNHVEIPRRITKVGGMSRKSGTPWRKLMALPKAAPSNYPFNDPLFGGQWPLYNDGTINANAQAGADINVLPAWEKTAGRSDVIVAVVDEGVEYTHPDLAANMWSGIGKNFCSGYNEDITWGQGHGTHVAGTIAAVNNNDVGISGMAGGTGSGDGVKIMTCQIFHPTDGRYDASSNATADAIKYAADNGAVICQNSWGYAAGSMSLDQWINQDRAVKEAIDYFIQYAGMSPDGQTQTGPMAGGVVIFAAGNENSGQPGYPAAYEPCISVAAVSCTYEAAWYTNYGPTVDICAPGGGDAADFSRPIHYNEGYNLSTLPTDLQNGMTFVYTNFRGEVETHTIDYVSETLGYGYMQGTSMACPHVSGACALAVSYNYGAASLPRVKRTIKLTICTAMAIMAVGCLIFQLFPQQLLMFFNASEEMLSIGSVALRIISVSFVLAGFDIIAGSVCQAIGNPLYSLITSVCRQLVVLLPVAWLLSHTGVLTLVWLAFPISELVSLVLSAIFLRRTMRAVAERIGSRAA